LNLTPETDIDSLVNTILYEEPVINESKKPMLKNLIIKLISKLEENDEQNFKLSKILRSHKSPITTCIFNKEGNKFITGSYDKTCRVWDAHSGDELLTLKDHKSIIYAVDFNNPFGDKIITGSFDKTAKLWDANTGQL